MAFPTTVFANTIAVAAVPARDEAERIADCLLALNAAGAGQLGIVLLVNNTTDGTVRAASDIAPSLESPIVIIERDLPPGRVNAGHARRIAMEEADRLAPADAPLLTTDADGRVEPGWLAATVRHLAGGADAVFGQAVIDPVEALRIPPALHVADAEECAFAAALDEIESLIDPDPHDPWPRHSEHSGASMAVTRAAFRAIGGVPDCGLGEDRAFAALLRRADARIRHARDVRVVVSGRILGRAEGGMADTIRRRLVVPDALLDGALEPTADRVRRLQARVAARIAFGARHAGGGTFGEAWAVADAAIPRRRVPVAALPAEMAAAQDVLRALQGAEAAIPVG